VSGIGREAIPFRAARSTLSAMVKRGNLAVALAAVLLLVFAAPSPAPVAPRKCGEISVSSKTYLVKADQVRCKTAKRWAKRYLREDWNPSGYTCRDGGSSTALKFRCWKGQRTYFAIKR
jgi:hypothetical protein